MLDNFGMFTLNIRITYFFDIGILIAFPVITASIRDLIKQLLVVVRV